MISNRINQALIATAARGRGRRGAQAVVLVPLLLLGSVLIARTAASAEQVEPPLPEPTPTGEASNRPLSLNLDRIAEEPGHGHSEFNLSLRDEAWNDPMVRLGFSLSCEEAAARRGGLVGYPVPFTAGGSQIPPSPVDLRLVFSGPFAADWQDLSTQERVVRVTETVVYYALIFEILRELGGRLR